MADTAYRGGVADRCVVEEHAKETLGATEHSSHCKIVRLLYQTAADKKRIGFWRLHEKLVSRKAGSKRVLSRCLEA